jgi:hypothetical protein
MARKYFDIISQFFQGSTVNTSIVSFENQDQFLLFGISARGSNNKEAPTTALTCVAFLQSNLGPDTPHSCKMPPKLDLRIVSFGTNLSSGQYELLTFAHDRWWRRPRNLPVGDYERDYAPIELGQWIG